MSAWDVALVWVMWNVVMPIGGLIVLAALLALIQWRVDRPRGKRRKG